MKGKLGENKLDEAKFTIKERLVFMFGIPFILFIIHLLPSNIQNQYSILARNNVSIFTLFLSNYTHTELSPLWGNILTYVLVMFLILKLETSKRRFNLMMAVLPRGLGSLMISV